ncbi:hypothetical protein BW730_09660 [Tessaracoccus aquimaris]|uniref:DUF11 domain-containing protein n=1 Tax=Tessaracoccus aquimaris TaxID=1332264 RepID=A0A1Q2CNR6_9ACTN|nr:hypothetical protein BW730_09660 [Tessaracoccus aquimaris]
MALLAALLLLATGQTLPANAAPDNATLELSKVVTGWAENTTVRPGQSFGYTLELSCNNSNFGGCDDAFLLDPIPAGLLLDGDSAAIKVTGSGVATRVRIEAPQTVRVDVINDLGDGKVGMAHGTTITVVVPVRVDPDLAQSASGTPIINTATADATNAPNEEASFPVKPEVPIVTAAVPAKSFDPEGGLASTGVKTTLKAQAANGSNVSVDAITITDPADPTAKPFQHLALTGALDVKLPDGAEHVRVDVMVGGAWVEGTAGPLPAELPDSVTPSDVEGIRLTFLSTDGPDIAPGATGSFDLGLVSRPSIATSGPIVNTIAATVTVGETTSTPGTTTATYTPAAADIPVAATKTFTPDVITAGKQSTVALTATNTSSHTLETLTITEPGSGANPLADTLTFAGWATSGVQWPNGATGLTVTYQVERDGEIVTVTEAADTPNTLPAAPADGRVIGFTATYSGAIVPGAEAKLPFTVSTDAAQAVDLAKHPNDIVVTSVAPGGYAGSTTAADELTTYKRRLDLEVGKKISPSSIVGTAGEDVVVRLTGHLLPFPQSTTEATTVIISDPADVAADAWYDSFAPTRIASTPVPTNATLTVQYFDGTAWHDVEGMVGLTGGVPTVDFPATVRDSALGIRFVYESTDGLAPDTRLAPNLGFELRATATEPFTAANCAAASAAADLVEPADAASPCPTITVSPEGTGPGGGAPVTIDKSWASSTIPQRLLAGTTVTLSWATHRSNLGKVVVSDGAAPSAATLPGSAFNSFDLLSIPAIWPSDDPLIAFDRVARVELYSLSRDAWVAKTGDPCPQGCDGQFPGVTLSDAERADTIGVRLVFEESPTRIDRIQNDPEAPAVGSGVARSLPGQSRPLKLTMRLRDELRKSPSGAPEPVLYSSLLGTRQPGEVPNDAGVTGWTDPTGSPVASDRDEASITVTDVPRPSSSTRPGAAARWPSHRRAPRSRTSGRRPAWCSRRPTPPLRGSTS